MNIIYVVFEVYSIEYRLKRIFKSLYFVFIYILHNFPTPTESALYFVNVLDMEVAMTRWLCTEKSEEDKLYMGGDSIWYDLQVKIKYVHLQEYVKYLSC